MKLKKGLLTIAFASIILLSVASSLQLQRNIDAALGIDTQNVFKEKPNVRELHQTIAFPLQRYDLLTAWAASVSQGIIAEKTPLPDNITRTEIFDFINGNPGVQFRAICGGLGLSIGVVQFHLAQLQKNGLITSFRKGRYKRFFRVDKFSQREMETIATVKLETVRNILKALLDGKRVSHHKLAVQLSISSQGLTWQMSRLRESGLVQENREGLCVTYSIRKTCVPLITQAMAITESN